MPQSQENLSDLNAQVEKLKAQIAGASDLGKLTPLVGKLQKLMGQVTGHDMDQVIPDFRKKFTGANYALEDAGTTRDTCKWYSYQTDMAEFSKEYPQYLFTLEGEGEEQGDHWKLYCNNGKSQLCLAIVTFEPFDPKKLA